MQRFWVSWWSGYYEEDDCTKPPFQVWISGQRYNDDNNERTDCSICALIDAANETAIWEVVQRHFPDYEERFCNVTNPDYVPGTRFPDFRNETSLV